MKICFFANSDFYLYKSRLNLMKELKKIGWEVFFCCPETNKDFVNGLVETGAIFLPTQIKRGIGLFSNIQYFFQIKKICKKNNFDLCHNFTPKVSIFASWAQKSAGIKNIICSVSGLGYVYAGKGLKYKFLQFIVNRCYYSVFNICKKVIFQNPDDLQFFLNKKIINKERVELIMGSGVDSDYFKKEKADVGVVEEIKGQLGLNGEIVVVMVSRLLWQKGVREFVEASEKMRNLKVKFVLVGPIDKESPDYVPSKNISEWEEKGLIQYLGDRKDIREILFLSDIFVFPSYYREGIPKVLLEAAAMEKPMVAADNVGTREIVEDGINGFLVRPQKSQDLSEAIVKLVENSGLRQRFGMVSRQKILQQFNDKIVINKTMGVYNSLIPKP
jgi:N,N'-diacetylbacillosaminyl-diphospho-undecaprenol alpha-1,3-N-acetylgalactosaminyltransferase